MTAATFGAWNRAIATAPVAPVSSLVGSGGVVVIAPHPDDETLGCSALLIEAAYTGRKLGLVALTDGGHSHPGSKLFPPERLTAIRRAEQEAAVAMLGCSDVEWLRLDLADGGSNHAPGRQEAARRVADLCERISATALAAPHPDDPHPDHHAAAAIALEVRALLPRLRILFYEVWTGRLNDGFAFHAEGLTPFQMQTVPDRKARAIACHQSQMGNVVWDDPAGFVMPDWFIAQHTQPFERISWLRLPGSVPDKRHFARLYADDGDPWHVRHSAYEKDKREAAVALLRDELQGRVLRRSLEAGCGEGHLSAALLAAGLTKEALGIDRDPTIIERAEARGWGERAQFTAGNLPNELPEGPFDLVILSEVLYFLDEVDLGALARNLAAITMPGATLLVVSWLGPTDTPLDGRTASDFFCASLGEAVESLKSVEAPQYRMELLRLR